MVYLNLKTEQAPQSMWSPLQHSDIYGNLGNYSSSEIGNIPTGYKTQTALAVCGTALLLRWQEQKRTGQIPNNLGEQRYASSKLPSFPIYICRKSHLNVIPTQGICCVLPPVTNNRPVMIASGQMAKVFEKAKHDTLKVQLLYLNTDK